MRSTLLQIHLYFSGRIISLEPQIPLVVWCTEEMTIKTTFCFARTQADTVLELAGTDRRSPIRFFPLTLVPLILGQRESASKEPRVRMPQMFGDPSPTEVRPP